MQRVAREGVAALCHCCRHLGRRDLQGHTKWSVLASPRGARKVGHRPAVLALQPHHVARLDVAVHDAHSVQVRGVCGNMRQHLQRTQVPCQRAANVDGNISSALLRVANVDGNMRQNLQHAGAPCCHNTDTNATESPAANTNATARLQRRSSES